MELWRYTQVFGSCCIFAKAMPNDIVNGGVSEIQPFFVPLLKMIFLKPISPNQTASSVLIVLLP